jgi:hypothetical protein
VRVGLCVGACVCVSVCGCVPTATWGECSCVQFRSFGDDAFFGGRGGGAWLARGLIGGPLLARVVMLELELELELELATRSSRLAPRRGRK